MYELNEPYIKAYAHRINSKGKNHKERELNYGIANFEKFLSEHPSSDTVSVDGKTTKASIASNKQDQYKVTKEILTRLSDKIDTGSIVEWKQTHWIVFQKEIVPNQAYNSCLMIQSNQCVKWIDDYGVERSQFAHIISSKDSIVKQNFRTWNKLITPQPNQYLEALIPSNPKIRMGQKFIINDRAWFVVEYDNTSVPNLTYYSFTEDKIDRLDDDVESGLANYKDKNKCLIKTDDIHMTLNDLSIISPTILLDGKVIYDDFSCTVIDNTIASIVDVDGKKYVRSLQQGETTITIYLTNHPEIKTEAKIVVQDVAENQYRVIGDNVIRVTDESSYTVNKIGKTESKVPISSFSISDETLAKGALKDINTLVVTANEHNRIGRIVLTINAEDQVFTKQIEIKSLW